MEKTKTIVELVMSKHKHMKERKMSIEVPDQKKDLKMDHIINVSQRDKRLFLPPSVVIDIVSTQTGIPYSILLENSENRRQHFVFPKMFISVYLLNFTDMNLSQIASACGLKSHATIKNSIKNFVAYSENRGGDTYYSRMFPIYTEGINNKIKASLLHIKNIEADAIMNKLMDKGLVNKSEIDHVHIKKEHYVDLTYDNKKSLTITYGESVGGKSIHIKIVKQGVQSHIHFSVPEFMAFLNQANMLMLTPEVQEFSLSKRYKSDLHEMHNKVLRIERTFEE